MSNIVWAKPKEPNTVRRPGIGKVWVPERGQHINLHDQYWARRVKDGSMIVCKESKKKPEKPAQVEAVEEKK